MTASSGRGGGAESRSAWLAQQTRASRSYFAAVMIAGALAVAVTVFGPDWTGISWGGVAGWTVLALLTSLSMGLQLRKIADGSGTATLRDVWSLAALFIWGLPAAVLLNLALVVWSESFTKVRFEGRSFVLARCGFNAAFTSVALVLAWWVLESADTNWSAWLLAGVTFEVVTVIAVELHLVANRTKRMLSKPLIILVATSLTEVPLAAGLTVAWLVSPLFAVILAVPVFVMSAGLQYILEFIELRDLVSTDSRTGLLTPTAWRQATEKLVRSQQAAVLMADLDNFKQLNDSFGHLVGDDVLKQVGDILTSSIRTVDLACRWGGEEFVLVLAGTPVQDAVLVAERIRARVHAESTAGGAPVTISIGVAGCPATAGHHVAEALTATMALADDALYQAKRDGRNRVAVLAADAH